MKKSPPEGLRLSQCVHDWKYSFDQSGLNNQHFSRLSLKNLFEHVDNRNGIDFIKETHVYNINHRNYTVESTVVSVIYILS